GRGEQEARLVEEHEVGLPTSGSTDDLGQFLTPSVVDRRLVPLPGPALGLLAGPLQPPLEHLADVLGVEAAVEVPLGQLGGPAGGASTMRSASRGPGRPSGAELPVP